MKKKTKIVKDYYKKFDKKFNFCVPNETIFRMLNEYNFNFKKKKCLDIGIGNGDNLLEFKRRGASIYGIDIRKNLLKKFIKLNQLPTKNFYNCDLNEDFPNIKYKFDLCLMKDTLYYLSSEMQMSLFNNVKKILKKNGYFLFQYIQTEFIKKNRNLFSYNFFENSKNLRSFHDKKNPLVFISKNDIMKLIKKNNFKIIGSLFDINTHKKEKHIIPINRYFLLKK